MNEIFRKYQEYLNFCTIVLHGEYSVDYTIDSIISAGLVHAPLNFNFDFEPIQVSEKYYGIKFFSQVNVIELLICHCKNINYAYDTLQFIFNKGLCVQFNPLIIQLAVKNYAKYIKYITNRENGYRSGNLNKLLTPDAFTFVTLIIDNTLKSGCYPVGQKHIFADLCDLIKCADVNLLEYMFVNNYIHYPKNINQHRLLSIAIENCLIECTKNRVIIHNIYSSIPSFGAQYDKSTASLNITNYYIEITKFLFKHNIISAKYIQKNPLHAINPALFECFQIHKLKFNIINGVYLPNIPTCIRKMISDYDWPY